MIGKQLGERKNKNNGRQINSRSYERQSREMSQPEKRKIRSYTYTGSGHRKMKKKKRKKGVSRSEGDVVVGSRVNKLQMRALGRE